ncbi:unnamed protein product, partial [Ranitomeya imitator]
SESEQDTGSDVPAEQTPLRLEEEWETAAETDRDSPCAAEETRLLTGGAVVILNKNEYVDEIKGQLADPGVYERLTCDPKFAIAREIKIVLDNALDSKIIDQDLYDFLTIKFPVTPVLYALPKIHKSLMHPPGRSIVSGCNSILSNIGILLDKILNPTAMGANMAPAYANIVMSVLEEDLVYVSHHFSYVAAWRRYIDDVFLIWIGTKDSLLEFHEYLNTIDETIKFTLVYSDTSIQFLDVNVQMENGVPSSVVII